MKIRAKPIPKAPLTQPNFKFAIFSCILKVPGTLKPGDHTC